MIHKQKCKKLDIMCYVAFWQLRLSVCLPHCLIVIIFFFVNENMKTPASELFDETVFCI